MCLYGGVPAGAVSPVLGVNTEERRGLQYIHGSVDLELSKRTNLSGPGCRR